MNTQHYCRPPQDLWRAVVIRAALDLLIHPGVRSGQAAVDRKNAVAWFEQGGADFRRVCLFAGICPDKLRSAYRNGRLQSMIRNMRGVANLER